MPSSKRVKGILKAAYKKFDKVIGINQPISTTCPTCHARWCSQNSRITLVEGAKLICVDCLDEMACKLHDEQKWLYRAKDWSEYFYYTKVKMPRSRKFALEDLYRQVELGMLGREPTDTAWH
ncbi:hypothetical protein CERZMDRAFT_88443 [Cercospora zeae-maydis SCOH1-5]|uniref:Uncharacterized protein n=1 Tax=Cercospora zeae-maydis SCOH1-5 TaxID=717836 RepID=A0A6A6F2R3_9PEZI|nr:hypothetical protein CERZMDRAFT_88443 [Cercospora zeae-maydis SCOH1-5]